MQAAARGGEKAEIDLGVEFLDAAHRAGHHHADHVGQHIGGDAHFRHALLQRLDAPVKLAHTVGDIGKERFSGGIEGKPGRGAVEEHHAHLILEFADRARDAGLNRRQRIGRAGHAAVLRHRKETAQVAHSNPVRRHERAFRRQGGSFSVIVFRLACKSVAGVQAGISAVLSKKLFAYGSTVIRFTDPCSLAF